jgi:hypothetical protein
MPFEIGEIPKGAIPFKTGRSGNYNGRPVGAKSKKTQLRKLIKHLSELTRSEISDVEKTIAYQLYDIAISDYVADKADSVVSHLYFIESDFGIKIGVSKSPKKRLSQIRMYAPSAFIIKIIPFAGAFEKKLHNKFKKQNIKNNPAYGIEWFYKNDDLISFIQDINTATDVANKFHKKQI